MARLRAGASGPWLLLALATACLAGALHDSAGVPAAAAAAADGAGDALAQQQRPRTLPQPAGAAGASSGATRKLHQFFPLLDAPGPEPVAAPLGRTVYPRDVPQAAGKAVNPKSAAPLVGSRAKSASDRARELVAQLMLDEKLGLLHNRHKEVPRLGLPPYEFMNGAGQTGH